MIRFAVYARIRAEHRDEFLEALREYLPAVSREASTLQYDVCEAASAPGTFLFYEAYPDDAAVKAHQGGEAFKAYIARIGPMLDGAPVSLDLIESAKG